MKDDVLSTLFSLNLEEGKTMLESYDVSDVVVLLGTIDIIMGDEAVKMYFEERQWPEKHNLSLDDLSDVVFALKSKRVLQENSFGHSIESNTLRGTILFASITPNCSIPILYNMRCSI